MKRVLLILATGVGLTACATIQYAASQRLMTEQQIAEERIWGEKDAMNRGLSDPWYWR